MKKIFDKISSLFTKKIRFDQVLIILFSIFIFSGTAMVFNTTSVIVPDNKFLLFFKHLIYTTLGVFVILIIYRIEKPFYKEFWFGVALALLTLTGLIAVYFFPPINKAHRWISLAGFHFQPSELAKLSIIIFSAVWLQRKRDFLENISSYLPIIILSVLYAGLIFFEKDVGTCLFVLLLSSSLIFLFLGLKSVPIILILGSLFSLYAIFNFEHTLIRIKAFLNPEKFASTSAYHYYQSVFAVGSGGIFGVGLGDSTQKLYFLPLSYNDYVYAIIGEELGFIGASIVLILYALLVYTLVRMTRKLTDIASILIIVGIAFHIGLQTLINVSVVLGILPAKGLTLPFISYGGSSQLVFLTEAGIVLSIAREAK